MGAVLALAAGRAMTALLYAVEPGDPRTLITVSALLATIGAAACYVPARRAARGLRRVR